MLRPIFRNIFIISRRYAPVRTKLHDNNTLALGIIDYQRARISYARCSRIHIYIYVGNRSTDSQRPKCNCLFIRYLRTTGILEIKIFAAAVRCTLTTQYRRSNRFFRYYYALFTIDNYFIKIHSLQI